MLALSDKGFKVAIKKMLQWTIMRMLKTNKKKRDPAKKKNKVSAKKQKILRRNKWQF